MRQEGILSRKIYNFIESEIFKRRANTTIVDIGIRDNEYMINNKMGRSIYYFNGKKYKQGEKY